MDEEKAEIGRQNFLDSFRDGVSGFKNFPSYVWEVSAKDAISRTWKGHRNCFKKGVSGTLGVVLADVLGLGCWSVDLGVGAVTVGLELADRGIHGVWRTRLCPRKFREDGTKPIALSDGVRRACTALGCGAYYFKTSLIAAAPHGPRLFFRELGCRSEIGWSNFVESDIQVACEQGVSSCMGIVAGEAVGGTLALGWGVARGTRLFFSNMLDCAREWQKSREARRAKTAKPGQPVL